MEEDLKQQTATAVTPLSPTSSDAATVPAADPVQSSVEKLVSTEASAKAPRRPKAKQAEGRPKAKTGTSTAPVRKRKRTSADTTPVAATAAPLRTLILDNGGDTVKYGWNDATTPSIMPNVTARLPQQWTVLVGDQLQSIQNPNQLIGVTRSTERGIITNLGNQVQVWKRILDLCNVDISGVLSVEAQMAFGWKPSGTSTAPSTVRHHPSQCAVLICVPPFTPRSVLDQIMTVWFDDFAFAHVGFCLSQVAASRRLLHREYQTACIVDLGWSATHVVPLFQENIESAGVNIVVGSNSNTKAAPDEPSSTQSSTVVETVRKSALINPRATIRRLALGGRHMINLWKYYATYRHWNLMDQEWLLRRVLQQTAFVSLEFRMDMQHAAQTRPGLRSFDRDFVLPDFCRTFEGTVQIPRALILMRQRQQQQQAEEDGDSADDSDVKEEDMDEEDVDMEVETEQERKETTAAISNENDEEEVDEEEETIEEKRKRILAEQKVEERRRAMEREEQQVLPVSVERFAIPEILFRPSDVGLPMEWAGLPKMIVQSVQSCPAAYQPALYSSIRLVGGIANLPNLKERLDREVRQCMPAEYALSIELPITPTEQAWKGAQHMVGASPYTEWCTSRQEWESAYRRSAWSKLLCTTGGDLI